MTDSTPLSENPDAGASEHTPRENAVGSSAASGGRQASAWNAADKVASGIDKAADVAGDIGTGIGLVLTKLWGLLLLVGGIALLVIAPSSWWAAILVAAYGVYLLLPGEKWVIW